VDVETKTKIFRKALPMLIVTVLFVWAGNVLGENSDGENRKGLVINEVLINPDGSDNKEGDESSYEWIELKNLSRESINVGLWEVRMGIYVPLNLLKSPIPPGGFILIYAGKGENRNLDFSENNTAHVFMNKSGSQLGDSKGDISLYSSSSHNKETIVDYVVYGSEPSSPTNHNHALDGRIWKKDSFVEISDSGYSIELKSKEKYDASDWKHGANEGGTPGKDNSPEKANDKNCTDICSDDVRINEVLANPSGEESKDEFIELYNSSDEDICLGGWKLYDLSLKESFESDGIDKGYFLKTSDFIEGEGYLVIRRERFKFSLHNSDDEAVYLRDMCGNFIFDTGIFNGSGIAEDFSYGFDGDKWRWGERSEGERNVFQKNTESKYSIPGKAYVDVYADFEIKTKSGGKNQIKITWDFGDGHRSYKAKTRHKYDKKGEYVGSVKVVDGPEVTVKEFKIKVGNYPHPDVTITAINPNPVGKDSELETITIKNKSKKKINLLGWSIATGWDKLVNHPIREDFEIKAGKEKDLTREHSAFSLNNKKTKIELRYPDGEVAYKKRYKNEDGIEEGTVYEKVDGEWKWVADATSEKSIKSINPNEEKENLNLNNQSLIIDNGVALEDIGKYSENETADIFELVAYKELEIPARESDDPQVLGARALWVDEKGFYRFGRDYQDHPHYAIVFVKKISSNANVGINLLLNHFSK